MEKQITPNAGEDKKPTKKAVNVCDDCWLSLFALLLPFKLGLKVALLSRRFDALVDEHFKGRKWTLRYMVIECRQINGTETGSGDGATGQATEMQIVNNVGNVLPIADRTVPKTVVGFEFISIRYIDHNVMAFLHRIRPLFASCEGGISLGLDRAFYESSAAGIPLPALVMRDIWPMLKDNICALAFSSMSNMQYFQCFTLSMLNNNSDNDYYSPSLRTFVSINGGHHFPVFSPSKADTLANDMVNQIGAVPGANSASPDGEVLANWLLPSSPPRSSVGADCPLPKVLKCILIWSNQSHYNSWKRLSPKIEEIKLSFAKASSRASFIIVCFQFPWAWSYPNDPTIAPFYLTNPLVGDQLTLKHFFGVNECCNFLLVRCPIVRDENKWTKWEEEAIEWPLGHQRNWIQI